MFNVYIQISMERVKSLWTRTKQDQLIILITPVNNGCTSIQQVFPIRSLHIYTLLQLGFPHHHRPSAGARSKLSCKQWGPQQP